MHADACAADASSAGSSAGATPAHERSRPELVDGDKAIPIHMRAMILPCYGPADALELANVPVPSIADEQVLVRVVATSVNPADCKQRSGNLAKVANHNFPVVLGQDFSGIVVRCGRACSRLQIGDAVFGATAPRNGCSAEYVAAYEAEATRIPDGLSWAQAAAAPTVVCTAYHGLLMVGKLQAAQAVLVHGASGGVDFAAARLAVLLGCRVWGTCSPANIEALRSAGVAPLNYANSDFDRTLEDSSLDLVLDTVGGDDYYHRSLRLLRRSGRYVTAVGPVRHGGSTPVTYGVMLRTAATLLPRLAGNALVRRTYHIFLSFDAADLRKEIVLRHVGALVRLSPRRFQLAELAAAHRMSETNHSDGKLVVRILSDAEARDARSCCSAVEGFLQK
jgi:NADPH:quinone reductase-like Zn-dependent oxidoreductase